VISSAAKAKYSLGAALVYRPEIWKDVSYKDVRVDVGVRLGNLPLWLEGGVKLDKTFSIGTRFEL
jgi:hypothetical protein